MSAPMRPVFVLRHYNDIDHMVPVIAHWTETMGPGARALVATHQTYDVRLPRLSAIPGLEVAALEPFVEECKAIAIQAGVSEVAALADIFLARLIPPDSAGAIMFDRNNMPLTVAVCQAARRRGIAAIAMPEGEAVMSGMLYRAEDTETDPRALIANPGPDTDFGHFDYHVFSSRIVSELFLHYGETGEKVYNGSARFCRQWLARINQFWPPVATDLPRRAGVRRVVLFLRGPDTSANWPEIALIIRLLARLRDIDIIVKIHTRENHMVERCGLPPPTGLADSRSNSTVRYVDYEVPSLDLLNWGEIFLSMSTSVTFQPIQEGKPALELSYAIGARPATSRYFPRGDIRSRDELLIALTTLLDLPAAARGALVHPPDELDRFRRDCIEPNGENVLDDHVAFLRAVIAGARTPRRAPPQPFPNFWGRRGL